MNRRTLKFVILASCSGGLLLQAVGCAYVLFDLLVRNFIGQVISEALAGLVTGANATAGG